VAVRNLHAQILFYNRAAAAPPFSLSSSNSGGGGKIDLKRARKNADCPFALSFLPLIRNFALLPDVSIFQFFPCDF
jgi:hypothetical protein